MPFALEISSFTISGGFTTSFKNVCIMKRYMILNKRCSVSYFPFYTKQTNYYNQSINSNHNRKNITF